MSDARARLNTHPMKTLNGLILGIKKGLPLELSLKKKRYTKKQLVDHLVMLGNKKLIDLSKIPALAKKAKSKAAAAAGIKAGDKLPYKKKAKSAKGKEVAAAGIKAGEKVAFKKKAKPAKGKEVAAAGIKAGEKVAFKKKTHKMPDGTVMSGATHSAESKPVKAKGKRKAKPVDELTLHKKQLKNDIKVLKSFLKRKIRPTRLNLMKSEGSVDGAMDNHQIDLQSALAQMGGSKLSMSAVFKETEELVKEQTELYSKYEKKMDELRKEVEKKEAAKPVKLSKEVKELMNQKPYESAEEKKKRVKERQAKIRKKLKSRIANARSDAIKEQEKKIRSQQEGITKGLGRVKFKRKPKKI